MQTALNATCCNIKLLWSKSLLCNCGAQIKTFSRNVRNLLKRSTLLARLIFSKELQVLFQVCSSVSTYGRSERQLTLTAARLAASSESNFPNVVSASAFVFTVIKEDGSLSLSLSSDGISVCSTTTYSQTKPNLSLSLSLSPEGSASFSHRHCSLSGRGREK